MQSVGRNRFLQGSMMRNFQAVLFPHSFAPDVDIKRVLSVFQEVSLFQPWFMDKPLPMATELPGLVHVLTPAEHLRPPENLKGLLAEYRQWIRTNDEKAFSSFLAFTGARVEADSPSWEIRSMVRRMGQAVEGPEKAISLKWHFILHLAAETEEEQREAEKMLKSLGSLGSPLKDALEEKDPPGLLSDLPGLDREVIFSEDRLTQILEAWAGLFSDKVPAEWPLITFSPQVMKYVTYTWEGFIPACKGPRPSSLELTFPDLSALSQREFLDKREAFFKENNVLKAIAEFCHDPGDNVSNLEDPADRLCPPSSQGSLRLALAYLFPLCERRIPRRYEFMKHFSGKIIGLVEETRVDEQ
jgi:hypothetical protein